MVLYTIQPISPEAHLFAVEVEVTNPDQSGQLFTIPAWIPGSYMIRDFSRNVVTLSATQNGTELSLEKLDKQTWRCLPAMGPLVLRYDIYSWDMSVRSAYLDITRGFFNGTSVFMKVVGQEQEYCKVQIRPPEGSAYRHWKMATTLEPLDTEFLSFGLYGAKTYADLIDHPVEMGGFDHASFEVEGVPHDIVISGRHATDMPRICSDLQRVCREHIDLYGELPEMERYLFLVFAVGEGYGGLEHRCSTALICSRNDLPAASCGEITDGYRQFLGLCSHEYFHLWNVKRIRPEVLKNADLSKEAYTRLLWAFEGITSYYDDLALLRSKTIDANSYLELLARQITRGMRGAGRRKQTLSDSSFDAWTKFYRQDENAPNAIVSYYNKGALVALALDLIIRKDTEGKKSLDDVMRYLWQRYGRNDIGLEESDVERVASDVSGISLQRFFETSIRQTHELPLIELLASFGVGANVFPARNSSDMGGSRDKSVPPGEAVPVLGASFKPEGQDIRLTHVFDDGAAQRAGMSAGDVVVAVSGIRVSSKDFEERITKVTAGATISMHAFRRDELMEFLVCPMPAPVDTCELWLKEEIDDQTKKYRSDWLGSGAD